MKRLLIFIIFVFAYLNTYGQIQLPYHVGKIVYMPKPCHAVPCTSGMVFGLEVIDGDSIALTIGGGWI
jgi:hypothetical protein